MWHRLDILTQIVLAVGWRIDHGHIFTITLTNGEMAPDRRAAYIRCGEEDSDIIFLGGEGFSTARITDEE
jgi:hypothetical protein